MKKNLQRITKQFRNPFFLAAVIVVGIIMVFFVTIATTTVLYRNKIYPGAHIGTLDLGGKTIDQAHQLLEARTQASITNIDIHIDGDKNETIPTSDFSLDYDAQRSAELAYAFGRSGNVLPDIGAIAQSLVSKPAFQAVFHYNEGALASLVEDRAKKYGDLPVDATIALDDSGNLHVTPAKSGFGIEPKRTKELIVSALGKLETTIAVSKQDLIPQVSEQEAALGIEATTQLLAKAPMTLTVGDNKTTVDAKQLFSWISFEEKPPTVAKHAFFPQVRATSLQPIYPVIDPLKVKDYIQSLAKTVNTEPRNAALAVENGALKVTKAHQNGQVLKEDESVTAIILALADASAPNQELILPTEAKQAEVRSDNLEALGLREKIATGETNFKGSPSNRVHNITTGSNLLNNLLIPPGKEFSTIDTLGKIDGSTGYLPELVIKENRTVPEFGGGLCQVSTTLFRTALNAGLKITERQNHSYRVSYYEPPLGLDATIYYKKPDLRFLNDTPGYIFVKSTIQGTKISFEFYGTKDGRSVAISDAVITDVTEPPTPIYTETDTLKKGETKQIEKPHQGAKTSVTYVVSRDGKEVNRQVFRSYYKAWAAQYLVGTKEE